MPTVIHELADAFLRRKQALAERGQAKTKLAGSDYFMPKSAKEDLNNRLSVFEQGGLPELLKQAGKEMYDNPIVNTAIGFTPGVGDVQAAGETIAALQRGAPWQETAGYAVGMLPFVPALRTTWHGSPHGFTKFDMSKIGTGEGAQAYGHGLYLAEAQDVAQQYQKDLTKGGDLIGGKPINQLYEKIQRQADRLPPQQAELEYEKLGFLEDLMQQSDAGAALKRLDNEDLLPWAEEIAKKWQPGGFLYKVDLPDEQIAKMLDWDKPLSQQAPEVLEALQTVDLTAVNPRVRKLIEQNRADGQTIYKAFGGYENPAAASAKLNELGIPGIQYLDQASRGAGEGTRNYVVFSDEIPKILERNGTSVFEFPKD